MRESLFRGKRKDNGKWVEGCLYYFHCESKIENEIRSFIILPDALIDNENEFEVIPETVGEWTGMSDKNGVKIFEGDIVQEEDMLSVCRFLCCVGSYAFVPIEMYKEDEEELYLTSNFRKLYEIYEDSGTDSFFENDVPWKFVTVISNIHDEPKGDTK